MCNFKSAIVIKDEKEKGGYRLLLSPWTEYHSELETIFQLKDGARLNYAKVEFAPKAMAEAHKVETYSLHIDQDRTPEWFSSEMKRSVTAKLAAYITRIIVTGDVCLLIGGQFIIAPDAKVECAHSMVINAMCGGTLSDMRGGTLSYMRGGTLSNMCGGTLSDMCGGTLSDMRGGTLSDMRGGILSNMCGGILSNMRGGTLSDMRGGTLSDMCGGTLSNMRGGTLSDMRGGTLSNMRGGTLSNMCGGTLSNMRGGTLSNMCGGTLSEKY
jgi:hypothetical protein